MVIHPPVRRLDRNQDIRKWLWNGALNAIRDGISPTVRRPADDKAKWLRPAWLRLSKVTLDHRKGTHLSTYRIRSFFKRRSISDWRS